MDQVGGSPKGRLHDHAVLRLLVPVLQTPPHPVAAADGDRLQVHRRGPRVQHARPPPPPQLRDDLGGAVASVDLHQGRGGRKGLPPHS